MRRNYFGKIAVCSSLILFLLVTSFGGAYAGTVLAATPDASQMEQTVEAKNDSGKIVGGLVALGLIAAIVGNKEKRDSSPNGSTAGVNATVAPSKASEPAPAPVAVKTPARTPAQAPSSQIKAAEQRAFDLLNADRRANGLPALKLNGPLVVLAENYGRDMIQRNFFSHYNPEGQSPFDRMRNHGISYRYAGENLAINSSVEAAERAFMNSPGHRANILNPNYTEVGVGVTYDSRGSVYVVQEFIGR